MFKYSNKEVNIIADKSNFNKNTTEKVLRLFSILTSIDSSTFKDKLVLKGGTAINLFMLDLPRLSVDIDLDYNCQCDREAMIIERSKIDTYIKNYMADEGYYLSDKSKFTHSLDSYVYMYNTTSGSKDILKIEINYSNRIHILDAVIKDSTVLLGENAKINRLNDEELIGTKIAALLIRTTPRDVYDVYNLFQNRNKYTNDLIKKIAIFYICLSSDIPLDFNSLIDNSINKIKNLNFQIIKETLLPVLHKGIKFDVEKMCNYVSEKIKELFVLDNNEIDFIDKINNKIFDSNILFSNYEVNDVSKHPMGIWKTR